MFVGKTSNVFSLFLFFFLSSSSFLFVVRKKHINSLYKMETVTVPYKFAHEVKTFSSHFNYAKVYGRSMESDNSINGN